MRIDKNNVTWVRNENGSASWYVITIGDQYKDITRVGERLK